MVDPLHALGFSLFFKRWTRVAHAHAASLPGFVEVEFRGIPAHAWELSTAQHLLASSCWVQALHADTAARRDLCLPLIRLVSAPGPHPAGAGLVHTGPGARHSRALAGEAWAPLPRRCEASGDSLDWRRSFTTGAVRAGVGAVTATAPSSIFGVPGVKGRQRLGPLSTNSGSRKAGSPGDSVGAAHSLSLCGALPALAAEAPKVALQTSPPPNRRLPRRLQFQDKTTRAVIVAVQLTRRISPNLRSSQRSRPRPCFLAASMSSAHLWALHLSPVQQLTLLGRLRALQPCLVHQFFAWRPTRRWHKFLPHAS
jgi:hypothetical protein